jgi:hypothetical protein
MESEVLTAAEVLIAAWATNDRTAYFALFAPEANFIFHNHHSVLRSRDDYAAAYDSWVVEDGFAVLECSSFNRSVTLYGDTAVFTHETFSRILLRGAVTELGERETIVFHRSAAGWLAVHEHVSRLPG